MKILGGIRDQLASWWARYAAAGVGVVIVLVVAWAVYDSTRDPCGEEKRVYRAYNTVLEVPEFPFDDDGFSRDTYFLVTDRIKDRYPDLWQERELALALWGHCEEINRPDPGDFDRGFWPPLRRESVVPPAQHPNSSRSCSSAFRSPVSDLLIGNGVLATPSVLSESDNELDCAATNTGSVSWSLGYVALDADATVAAAWWAAKHDYKRWLGWAGSGVSSPGPFFAVVELRLRGGPSRAEREAEELAILGFGDLVDGDEALLGLPR